MHKSTNYDSKDIIKRFKYDECTEYNVCTNYAKDNIYKSNKYKHTFKLNKNGIYYWYSSEIVK